jgi:ubiquinone/menaquinone biosynthesis C-methylase UbiE
MKTAVNYLKITEVTDDLVSREQVQRSCDRYYWAKQFCEEKVVLEVGCGTGQGLGYLSKVALRFVAGDFSLDILKVAKRHYGSRVELLQFDAQHLPFANNSMDVIILFEAIYYVPDADLFIKECRRMLKPNGKVLIATANKDLSDFNPSPHTYQYFGVLELHKIFDKNGFSTQFFGNTVVSNLSLIQRLSRPLKQLAVNLNLMPKTADGKKWLKRIIFGKLVKMPGEIKEGMGLFNHPTPLNHHMVDKDHKVIYCASTLLKQ